MFQTSQNFKYETRQFLSSGLNSRLFKIIKRVKNQFKQSRKALNIP